MSGSASSSAVAKTPPQSPEPGRLRELARTHSYTLGRPFHVRLTPNGERIFFLRATRTNSVADLFVTHLSSGKTEKLLSAQTLLAGRTETLSAAEKAARERQRIKTSGFTSFEMSSDGDRLVLKLDGQLFLYDWSDQCWVALNIPGGPPLTPKLSTDAKKLAFVQDHNLAVTELPDKLPKAGQLSLSPTLLSTDGTPDTPNGLAEFIAQEEMSRYDGFWWAPDGQSIVFQKNDARKVEHFSLANAARPEEAPLSFAYPRPGQKNVEVRLFEVELKNKKTRELQWPNSDYPYLAKVVWQQGGPLTLLAQARDQRSQVLLYIDPSTGKARPFFEERDEAWLNIHNSTPYFLRDGKSFLWATEEGGAWRLERKHLSKNGLAITRRDIIVPPEAAFHALLHVDENHRWIYFSGGEDPAQLHIFRTRLDGSSPVQPLTQGVVGRYEASFASTGKAVALTRVSLESLPETEIFSISKEGHLSARLKLPHDAESPTRKPEVELIPFEKAAGFRAAVIRPKDFDSTRTYPTILYVYGGPGFSLVRADMSNWFLPQWIADHGFIVVSLDARGTPRRGRNFERVLRKRFHEVPLEDHVKGLKAIADYVPQIDMKRVGVYGWSFGGYLAALSVLRRPDVFSAGVAGAPVVDWMYYDTHYTERYLGVPDASDDPAYTQANLLSYAQDLEQPLMLIHGVADDNVYFAHSLQLADALFRAGKNFEFVPLVDSTHQVAEPSVREALFLRIVHFFGQRLW